MAKKTKDKQVLQWHPAFFASIQIELAEEADKLIFENEHQLGTKPKEIDVLIIKKNSEEQIHKNLGRIFRKHNIVEYKSPDDYLSMDIIVKANRDKFQEVNGMCDALIELCEEWMEDKIVERENIAKQEEREKLIIDCLKRNKDVQTVSDFLGIPLEIIKEIEQKMLQSC